MSSTRSSKEPKLRALSESAEKNRKLYSYNEPNSDLLETFSVPKRTQKPFSSRDKKKCFTPASFSVTVETDEFTALCPLTGQPDYGTLKITYSPRYKCLESKSFKLYLMGYRQFGCFHESIVARVAQDLVNALDPDFLQVTGVFKARGGVSFTPTAVYKR